jgi:hypothetical protein
MSDPTAGTNPDLTRTLTWDFTDPANYTATDADVSGGQGMLEWENATVVENTMAGYSAGVRKDGINITARPGSILLNQSASTVYTMTFQPGPEGTDSYIREDSTNSNYGDATVLNLDSEAGKGLRPLLMFDLSSIPSNAVVLNATLYLTLKSGRGNDITFGIHAIDTAWVEMEVCWDFASNGNRWTAGGSYNPFVFYRGVMNSVQGPHSMDVSRLVDLWVRGSLPNHGMILVPESSSPTDSVKSFISSDEAVRVTERPKLVVNLTTPGRAGTYESRAIGPGTNSVFTLASWSNGSFSKLSDEFNGTSLSKKWTWLNDPSRTNGSYDVGLTHPGWLHILGESNKQLKDTTLGVNFLYQNVTGSFRATTLLNTSFSATPMGAGMLLVDDPMSWAAIYITGSGSNANINVDVAESGVSVTRASIAWSGLSQAYLRMDRYASTITFYYSSDGIAWTLADTYAPPVPFMSLLALGMCVFSGTSSSNPEADYDYFRVDGVGSPLTVQVMARLGNSTSLTDPSWEAWGAPLPSSLGSVLGRQARYVQYQVVMTSTQDWLSPSFDGFLCHYERYRPSGVIQTRDEAVSHLREWMKISTTEQMNGGTVNYSYSTNHGLSWNALVPGQNIVSDPNPYIIIRMDIWTPDTLTTPTALSVTAQYAVAASSFYVVTPATVVAGTQFSFTIEAKDEFNQTITHWAGTVGLHAMDATGTAVATSELSVTSAQITLLGRTTVRDEVYTVAETIRILASAEGAMGLSEPITVVPAQAASVTIEPNITQLPEFSAQAFTATAWDAYGNEVPGANYTWSADPAIGTLNTTWDRHVLLSTGIGRQEGYLSVTADGAVADLYLRIVPPMYPPVITGSIPDQVKPEDYGTWTLNITSYVSDVEDTPATLRWYVTNETLVTVRNENRTGNMEIELTTKKDLFGTNILTLVVVDSDGLTASTTVRVTITPVNDAPTIDHIAPLVVQWGVDYAYDFKYYVHDVDNTYEQLTLRVNEASTPYAEVKWLTVIFNYPEALNGTTQYVVVTVSDGQLEASTVVMVTVSDDRVPVSERLPDLTMNQGEARMEYFNLDNYFNDPNEDVLYFASGYSHVRITINVNHTVDFYAPIDWYGMETVVFSATDPEGARAEEAMTVTVLHINQRPSIDGVPNLMVRYEERFDFDLAPYIADPDNALDTLTISTNDTHIAVIGATISLLYPRSMNGLTVPVTITVSDGELMASYVITVTISDDSPPRAKDPPYGPPDHSFLEDAPTPYPVLASLSDFFTDDDGAGSLTFLVFTSRKNVTATAVRSAEGNWSVDFGVEPNWNGMCQLTIRAIDPHQALAEATVSLEVIPVPDPPSLNILPKNITVSEGAEMAIDLSGNVTDPDVDDVEFTFAASCLQRPEWDKYIAVHGNVLMLDFVDFLGTSERSRTLNITVRATDHEGLFDTDTLTVTVVKMHRNVVEANEWFYLGMVLLGGTAFGLFMVAAGMRKRPFVVKDMMLIHNDGFLISRLAHHLEGEIDEDVLSGMLTAVLNFVEDSMATNSDSLKTFGFKEYQVLVRRGQKVFVAVVFEGDQPDGIDKALKDFLDTVERVYRKKLASWTGDIETDFAGVEVLIQAWVKEHSRGGHGAKLDTWVHKQEKQPEQPAA